MSKYIFVYNGLDNNDGVLQIILKIDNQSIIQSVI
ncbi:hypothetical protein Xekj_00178 [Xenorhabdus sp. KJ12.1]|nr:hypothetical protein Xekj_00178 [Xenorhabdus sp. KJ12.1]